MFEITPMNPEAYRQQTRRSTLIVVAVFAVLGMLCATLAVQWFGEPGGDNFRWNLAGVLLGVLLTAALVRGWFRSQPWMAAAVYGWQLKRSLMSVTNVMHHVTAAVDAGDPQAMKLLRFYHLGLIQMHQLDGNTSGLSQMVHEIDAHKNRLEALGLETEQNRLDPAWIEAVKHFDAKPR